jgi:hypothetical protein
LKAFFVQQGAHQVKNIGVVINYKYWCSHQSIL